MKYGTQVLKQLDKNFNWGRTIRRRDVLSEIALVENQIYSHGKPFCVSTFRFGEEGRSYISLTTITFRSEIPFIPISLVRKASQPVASADEIWKASAKVK